MDLSRHLRHFLVVAEELHFGRAAQLIGIAQPPLSQSIQRLERDLGVTLFDRTQRRIALTTAGQLLVDEARELLAREQRLRTIMRKTRDGELGTIRAGVLPETPATILQALLRQTQELAPGLSVDLHELTTAEQLRLLATAELDIGLVDHPINEPDLCGGPLVELPLGVMMPRTSPLARLREVSLDDLSGHDLVIFPRATAPGWHDRLLELCRINGFAPTRIRHARNTEFQLGLILGGHGVAFEQEAIARREPRVAWRPITGRTVTRRMSWVWPVSTAHPAVPSFAELAIQIVADTPTPTPLATPGATGPWSVVYAPPTHGAPGAVVVEST